MSQSDNTVKIQIQFISDNFSAFEKEASKKDIDAFYQFRNMLVEGDSFIGGQISYIDGLYEKTMKGLGLPSYRVKHK